MNDKELARILSQPGYSIASPEATAAPVSVDVGKGSTKILSMRFEGVWALLGGEPLEAEVRFHPKRMWRFDYANREAMVAIEVEGGIYGNGRHTRAGGYKADVEKYNAAALLGWTLFRLATGMMTPDNIEPIVLFTRKRCENPAHVQADE